MDTRPAPDNVGGRSTPLVAGEELTRQVTGVNGNCNIPATATAIAYNLTIPTSIDGFLTIFPADAVRPRSSSINPVVGERVKANGGIVGLSASGAIKLFTLTGPVDAIVDITGYFTTPASGPSGAIPSGATATGEITYDHHQGAIPRTGVIRVELPGPAPVPLTAQTVNFSVGSGAGDGDAACTGTARTPTAPPGKVCIYRASTGGITLSSLNGNVFLLADRSFVVFYDTTGVDDGDLVLYASWAYTAP